MSRWPDSASLARSVAAGDLGAVARAISIIEDRRSSAEPRVVSLLRQLTQCVTRERCHRVGLTGPPGAGKSSLVSALARAIRQRGRSLGVLAVDPSSPRSGGALLGDRARIDIDPDDSGLFVRSMASGGDLGGLARAAGAAVDVLSAAFDVTLVETTGVGQSETDVEHIVDTVIMVIQPGSGDVLQFLKAGIIEIPDVFIVNKADLGAIAQRAVADLRAALGAVHQGALNSTASDVPPVIATSATTREGLEALLDAVDAHWTRLVDSGRLTERRTRSAATWALRLFTLRYGEYGVERSGGRAAVSQKLRRRIEAGETAVEAVASLGVP